MGSLVALWGYRSSYGVAELSIEPLEVLWGLWVPKFGQFWRPLGALLLGSDPRPQNSLSNTKPLLSDPKIMDALGCRMPHGEWRFLRL